MGSGHHCMFLLGIQLSFSRPFLKAEFAVSNHEWWCNIFLQKIGLLVLTIKVMNCLSSVFLSSNTNYCVFRHSSRALYVTLEGLESTADQHKLTGSSGYLYKILCLWSRSLESSASVSWNFNRITCELVTRAKFKTLCTSCQFWLESAMFLWKRWAPVGRVKRYDSLGSNSECFHSRSRKGGRDYGLPTVPENQCLETKYVREVGIKKSPPNGVLVVALSPWVGRGRKWTRPQGSMLHGIRKRRNWLQLLSPRAERNAVSNEEI